MYNSAEIFTPQVSIIQFTFWLKSERYFLNIFYTKARLSQTLLHDMEQIKKNFSFNNRHEKCYQSAKTFFIKIIRKMEWPILISVSDKMECVKNWTWVFHKIKKFLNCPSKLTFLEIVILGESNFNYLRSTDEVTA